MHNGLEKDEYRFNLSFWKGGEEISNAWINTKLDEDSELVFEEVIDFIEKL